MSAPKGNRFWQERTKHGRDKLFSTPDILWEECEAYFTKTDGRKWVKKDWVGKDAVEVKRETETPYTWQGLFVYLDIHHSTWTEYEKNKDFTAICTRVRNIITAQKLEGAIVGAYNAQIVARDLGLKDQIEQSGTVTNLNHNVEMSKEEIQKISDGLEKEV